MDQLRIDVLEKIPANLGGVLGDEFYVQRFFVNTVAYRILFVPLEAEATETRERIEAELGPLPPNMFEVKFALGLDFDNGVRFATPKDYGLPPLNRRSLATLGEGLVECIMQFGTNVDCEGFVAMALDSKPGLNLYYQRLLQTHHTRVTGLGYEPKSCLGGQGYALLRNQIEISFERAAGAEA
ncbi:hypothetical protein ABFV43_18450 [Pseudomonas fulva]|uniref:hypothetical protein n=1 Tax=Pseudomonas TaxID=286 RepID=UPI001051EB83|nr:hypothetical protein [Pseudomonas sp. LP_4_YM]TCT95652.1 hypothetical protein EC913_109118 [Pseudomonas sp. LP_4_YM]